MTEHSKPSHIVDDCLQAMFHEGRSIEECMDLHPEGSRDLKPLLTLAAAARGSLTAYPAESVISRSRSRLETAIREAESQGSAHAGAGRQIVSSVLAAIQRIRRGLGLRGNSVRTDHEELVRQVDDCLQSVLLEGMSINDCLARYPDRALELEPLLALAIEGRRTVHDSLPVQSLERSRQRLSRELSSPAADPAGTPPRRFALSPMRLTLGMRAASMTVAVVVIGAATVGVSRGALPGEMLYPVKLGAEQVQSSLATSSATKAKLALARAERRASEIATLLEAGNFSDASAASGRFQAQLSHAAESVLDQRDTAVRQELQSELEQIAQEYLGQLDAIAMASPGSDVAFALAQTAAAAYADAVETAGASNGTPSSNELAGRLDLRLMDADASDAGIESFIVEITRIEVRRAGSANDEWSTVLDRPATFDLLDAANMGVASVDLAAGTYIRLRLTLGNVTVTSGGVSRIAEPVSTVVTVSRPLAVREGLTSTSILDFNVDRSLTQDDSGAFAFEPVILLRSSDSAHEPSTTAPRSTPEELAVKAIETGPQETLDNEQAASDLPSLRAGSRKDHPNGKAVGLQAPDDDQGRTPPAQSMGGHTEADGDSAKDKSDKHGDLEAVADDDIDHGQAVKIVFELIDPALVGANDAEIGSHDSGAGNSGQGNGPPPGADSNGGGSKSGGDSPGNSGQDHRPANSNKGGAQSNGGGQGNSSESQESSSAASADNGRGAQPDAIGQGNSGHGQGSSTAKANNDGVRSDGDSQGNSGQDHRPANSKNGGSQSNGGAHDDAIEAATEHDEGQRGTERDTHGEESGKAGEDDHPSHADGNQGKKNGGDGEQGSDNSGAKPSNPNKNDHSNGNSTKLV